MGKTKTAFVGGTEDTGQKPSYDKAAKMAKRKAKEEAQKVHLSGLKGGQRVKMVEATTTGNKEAEAIEKKEKEKKRKVRGKKYQELKSKVDHNKLYQIDEAIKLVKETSYSKFDGTVELHLVVKKTGLTTNVNLPHSSGKTKKIEIADEKTIEKLKTNKIDFDLLLATAEMMPKLVPFARILGPKGLMPNPKNGTVIKSAKDADKFKGNNLTIKTEKEAPLIHTIVGKVSQKETELEANIKTILDSIGEKQITKAFLKATMSPSVKLSLNQTSAS